MFRYLAFVWDTSMPSRTVFARHLIDRALASNSGWHEAFSREGMRVLLAGCGADSRASQHLTLGSHGIILGTMFRKDPGETASCQCNQLSDQEVSRVVASSGQLLIDAYWGRYVALFKSWDRRTAFVIRDPTGNLPCYHAIVESIHVLFAYVPDLLIVNTTPLSVEEAFLWKRVAAGPTLFGGSGLVGISEIARGERLAIRGGEITRCLLWDPKRISLKTRTYDLAAAAEGVRSTFLKCADAWGSIYDSVLVRLSGGLDSSSVVGALSASPRRPRITCVTYYMPDALADERPWARLACSKLDCSHIEHQRDVLVDLRGILEAQITPVPLDYFLFLEITPLERQFAANENAAATLTGDGGDTLFGSDCRDFMVNDFLRRKGFSTQLYRVAVLAALLTNTTVWSQLSKVFSRSARQWVKAELIPNRQLLSDSCLRSLKAPALSHPWFSDSRPDSWALFLQLLPLAANISVHDPFRTPDLDRPEVVDVINSQPLVELCLQIPLAVHSSRGLNRATLRRAMQGIVPSEILARTWKDRSPGSTERLLDHNLPFIRDFLMSGHLAASGILDKAKLDSHFSTPPLRTSAFVHELLDHLYVEAWYQICKGVSASGRGTLASSSCYPVRAV